MGERTRSEPASSEAEAGVKPRDAEVLGLLRGLGQAQDAVMRLGAAHDLLREALELCEALEPRLTQLDEGGSDAKRRRLGELLRNAYTVSEAAQLAQQERGGDSGPPMQA